VRVRAPYTGQNGSLYSTPARMDQMHSSQSLTRFAVSAALRGGVAAFTLAVPALAHAQSTPAVAQNVDGSAPGSYNVAAVDPTTQAPPAQPGTSPGTAPNAPPAPDATAPDATTPLAPSPLLNQNSAAPPNADSAASTSANSPPAQKPMKFDVGVRVGYGKPLGNLAASQPLGNYYSGAIPITVDGWLRMRAGLALGVYGGLAVGIQGKALDNCDGCSLFDWRAGVQAGWHANSFGAVDPWVGLGLGFEATSVSQDFNTGYYDYTLTSSYSAFPELTASAGVDFGNEQFAFGPFVSLSYATYSKANVHAECNGVDCGTYDDTGDVAKTSSHGWLMIGLRSAYMR
jgi:hypothetical protein